MKVLFLDIDGVINNVRTPTRQADNHLIAADPFCTFQANRIWDLTDCQVVLSSSWRHNPTWREEMKVQGLVFDFLDRTTTKGEETLRGLQIREWLEAHPEVTHYAILDDNNWMLLDQQKNFFKTSWEIGLTEEIAEKVIAHLNRKYGDGQCQECGTRDGVKTINCGFVTEVHGKDVLETICESCEHEHLMDV